METALENKGLIEKLNDPNTMDSLERLLDQLPGIAQRMDKLDQLLTSAESVMADPRTVEKIKLKLDHTNIDWNTLESGIYLLEKLPSLLQVIERLEQAAVFAEDVMKDEKSIQYLLQNVEDYTIPLKERFSQGKRIWEEVRSEAEKNTRQISLLTIMKWIKEPQVQRLLAYVQAFINVIPNLENRKGD
ncbi:hypothetical protein [Siminovitchia terrae]|uniref:hypothetical protein n=1 Tax=Siminovitchia terrae TaxID=1914933 RepID=UPI0028AC9C8F|nr:hypothetical protein [Siminovitchia terrae]